MCHLFVCRKMKYEEAMDYIKNYRSTGISLGLDRMKELCFRLGNPENRLAFVHVAGTNGKGSTAAYISSILGTSGLLVGRYVSPVVFQYEECIQFEDSHGITYIDSGLLAEVVSEVANVVEEMKQEGFEQPTIFEVETAMAFLAFVKKQCQIVVLEVGLGGSEDATNVIQNVVASVITPVSMDHMGILGDTLTEIATQKAGIIREGVPVISFQTESLVREVLKQTAFDRKCHLYFVEEEDIQIVSSNLNGNIFYYKQECYESGMTGSYQISNACLAIETCNQLKHIIEPDDLQMIAGIRKAVWPGRFELISSAPLIVVDGAHNPGAAEALAESIKSLLPNRKIHGIMGCFRDKEYDKIINIMSPVLEDIVTVTAPTERGLEAEKLAKMWEKAGIKKIYIEKSVQEGLGKALELYQDGEAIVIFGSLSLLSKANLVNFAIG